MRKLLACLLLVSSSALADTAAYSVNQNGGKIILTDVVCANNSSSYMAYSQSPNTTTLFGCWFSDDTNVHIVWNDGDIRSYPFSGWNINVAILRRMKANR